MKDKARNTPAWTYDLGFFATLSLLFLTFILSSLYSGTLSNKNLITTASVLLLGGAVWYIARIVLGVFFLFKYRVTKNTKVKKTLQQKMDWGFKGFLLLGLIFMFYFILNIYLAVFAISSGGLQTPKFTPN